MRLFLGYVADEASLSVESKKTTLNTRFAHTAWVIIDGEHIQVATEKRTHHFGV